MKKKAKNIFIIILMSLIMTIVITSYFGEYQKQILMPIRNYIYFGEFNIDSNNGKDIEIKERVYKDTKGYNPVSIAQLVRKDSLKILDNKMINKQRKKDIIKVSNWFIANGVTNEFNDMEYKLWYYNFDYNSLNLKSPWLSGMAQGHIIEVLLSAYEITNNSKYLNNAKLAANSLYVPVSQGGTGRIIADGIWFEEYASKSKKPFFTLNGHNYALNGVWHLTKYSDEYIDLFKKGVRSLEILLPQFDANIWSKYDLRGIPANDWYHKVHIDQLNDLYNRTEKEIFKKYSARFDFYKYLPFSSLYRLITYPNNFLILKYCINFLLSLVIILFFNKIKKIKLD